MDWDRIEGNWKQFSGKAKQKWGELTDDELDIIDGNREELQGKLQAKYGKSKDEARHEIDEWQDSL
ncbi:MAG: CsbD family protein [Woeseia sp.]